MSGGGGLSRSLTSVDFSESHRGVRDICMKSDASISPFKKKKKKHLEESEGGKKQTKKLLDNKVNMCKEAGPYLACEWKSHQI